MLLEALMLYLLHAAASENGLRVQVSPAFTVMADFKLPNPGAYDGANAMGSIAIERKFCDDRACVDAMIDAGLGSPLLTRLRVFHHSPTWALGTIPWRKPEEEYWFQ